MPNRSKLWLDALVLAQNETRVTGTWDTWNEWEEWLFYRDWYYDIVDHEND